MKKVFLLFIAAFLGVVASAQKVFFIYLQTEDQTPFFVRMGDKIYSSAASGYLILPNLVDSTYYFSLGFAKSTDPETKFSVAINQNDRGFLIKKFDDGLSLFDLEELSVVKSNAVPKDNTVYETKTDAFSTVLSKAANDPSIVKVPVAKKEEPAKPKVEPEKKEDTVVLAKNEDTKPFEKLVPETTSGTSKIDSSAAIPSQTQEEKTAKTDVKNDTPAKLDTAAAQVSLKPDTAAVQQPTVTKTETQVQESAYKPSVIVRRSESSTTEGFGVVYFDKGADVTDTIRILIPASKIKLTSETESNTAVEVLPAKEKVDTLVAEKPTETNNTVKEGSITKERTPVEKPQEKSACSNLASDKDFLKLRKKMAAKENDDEMITEAKKEFKNRCYTVEQIRYLSTLFLTSGAKYQFFDVAYQHVADASNFASLGSEIKDDYYLKRFKALVGE
jgi:hypothetical protein